MNSATNLDAQGVRQRRIFGALLGIAAVAVCGWAVWSGQPTWVPIVLLPIFFGAALSLLQAKEKV